MKIAITGHTKGIGKCLYERCQPDILGFSRSNGYDINSSIDRRRIINDVSGCDVFINNASNAFGQTQLLISLFNEWKDQPKIIINVGSRIAEISTIPIDRLDLLDYQSQKLILKLMSLKLADISALCKTRYVWFGYVGTEAILAKYPHFTEKDFITEDAAVDLILAETRE